MVVKLGIVGTGVAAQMHLEAIKLCSDVVLESVFSRTEARGKEFVAHLNAQVETDWTRFTNTNLDAVIICSPSGLHLQQVIDCLAADKHVLVEKPAVLTLPDAIILKHLAKQQNKVLRVVLQHRYDPASEAVVHALSHEWLGAPVFITGQMIWHRGPAYFEQSPWRGTLALNGGGVLINQAIHVLDLMTQFMGLPLTMQSWVQYHGLLPTEGEDTAHLVMHYKNGCTGTFFGTILSPNIHDRTSIEILGTAGQITLEDYRITDAQFISADVSRDWLALCQRTHAQQSPSITQCFLNVLQRFLHEIYASSHDEIAGAVDKVNIAIPVHQILEQVYSRSNEFNYLLRD